MMRRQMKLAAVLIVVVLALTGFTTSTSGGKSGKSRSGGSSSSGGGCSSSKKSNNGYSSTRSHKKSSTGSGTTSPTVRVVRCAEPGEGARKAVPSSLVEVRAQSRATGSRQYRVDVRFLDAAGRTVDTAVATTSVKGGESRRVTVPMDDVDKVSQVERCEATVRRA
ncbi:hypothetical protein [Streptomyces sp. NPDC101181]|uniref:hypothetical protein n=1 Tax=Streptomyces sp. NPDC101181 TaxID=3366125 RepID=UPI00380793BE